MTVTNHIQLDENIFGMTVHANSQHLTVVALAVPIVAPRKTYSDRLIRLRIDGEDTVTQMACQLPKEYASIVWSWPETDETDPRSNHYVAVPYLDDCFDIVAMAEVKVVKTIEVIQSDEGGSDDETNGVADPDVVNADVIDPDAVVQEVNVVTTIEMVVNVLHTHQTVHRVCHVEVGVYRDFMMSWSNDGVVQLWSKIDWNPVSSVVALSSYANGVAIAVTDPFRQ